MSRSPSKADLEKDNTRLREALKVARNEFAELIASKTRIARSEGSLIFELGESYPALDNLISWLTKAHHAASPLRSPSGGRRNYETPDPTGNRATAPGPDRDRLEAIDGKLEDLATWIEDRMGDRGPLDDKSPICWNPECNAKGWAQPYFAEVCISCGDDFGKHRFKPTLVDGQRRRCKIRGCKGRDKVGQCEHSL